MAGGLNPLANLPCRVDANGALVVSDGGSGFGITQLTGDVTAGPGAGSQAATIANNAVTTAKIINEAVTLAKIQDAAANSKLLGSGAAGAANPYEELTLGTNLSMSGTTINAAGATPSDIVLTGTYAALPAAGTAGRIYIPTDSPYTLLRDTGATWAHFYGGHELTPPVFGDFAWVNQEDATATTTNGGIYLTKPFGTQIDLAALVKSAPSTPYTITVGMLMTPDGPTGDSLGCGVCWRDSGDGKMTTFGSLQGAASWAYGWLKLNSPTSVNTEYDSGARPLHQRQRLVFMRLVDDGTDISVFWSYDNVNYFQRATAQARTGFMTPNQVGFYVDRDDAGGLSTYPVHIVHWVQA